MGSAILASNLEQIGTVLHGSLTVAQLPTEGPSVALEASAVLTPPGDLDGLCRGLRFLVEHPDWRSSLGANARREALARYTWDRHVDAILTRLTTI